MQSTDRVTRKKILAVWVIIASMIVIGSFSIGFTDITGTENKGLLVDDTVNPEVVQRTMISGALKELFENFDANRDGQLQFSEAEDFFYWLEEHITYRLDDESVLTITGVGGIVGDNRPGRDYRQTPDETFEEGAGDCEDMATLTVAFFNYFGIEAYVSAVNSEDPNVIDHAVAIVRVQDFPDKYSDHVGLVVYSVGNEVSDIYGNPVSPGTYMLVDNAYSDTFGRLSGGLEPDTFKVHCFIPLEQGYKDEWNIIVSKCR